MSDATPQTGTETAPASSSHQLNETPIEKTLRDFRQWFGELPGLVPPRPAVEKKIDLFTLVEQFIALKHEVNLQTRASRAATEQNGEAIKTLTELTMKSATAVANPSSSGPSFEDRLKPFLKGVIDAYDSLSLSLIQIRKQKDSFNQALETLLDKLSFSDLPPVSATLPTPLVAQSFWGRMFNRKQVEIPEENPLLLERQALDQWREDTHAQIIDRQEVLEEMTTFLDRALNGLLVGYEMSLNRLDRLLTQFELQPIRTVGEPFDPETMEAIEVIPDGNASSGQVVEELRRGYRWRGVIFRFAQVRVAR